MTVTTPDWLARHDCQLRLVEHGAAWAVYLGNEPQYLLQLVPVAGKHGCKVTQTINGRRLDNGTAHATPEEALQAGLEDLRRYLGW